ncbi:MAG: hypothetical protein K6G83_02800 [Lachnospiraceae bacterium]|nr:hypothetical protein [Lachnospiraceae bacterium]
MEKLLREVDFTQGSDHKELLREKLFGKKHGESFSDELSLDELKNVKAARKDNFQTFK